ncbi:hypothetical protein Acr_00g0045870 [Actinidia rufa]|uniref:F-box domain-containing protein n=1 Tax=Actinidia rufa TaxID=165716 RepID=A0A7J0DJH2_9ERIC|nr:hypothetical protein Acr_00g0045870 [Actinidia rufa]
MPSRKAGRHRRDMAKGAMSAYNIPNDIIVRILSRLPVKSLARFRCVCKPWQSLSPTTDSSPSITTTPSSFTTATAPPLTTSSLSLPHPNPISATNLHHPFPPRLVLSDMDLVGSINGLVCPPLSPHIALWNPQPNSTVTFPHLKSSVSIPSLSRFVLCLMLLGTIIRSLGLFVPSPNSG